MRKKKNNEKSLAFSKDLTTHYKKLILILFQADPGQHYTIRRLYKQFDASDQAAQEAVKGAMKTLVESGKLYEVSEEQYALLDKLKYVIGQVDHVNPSYAYVVPQGEEEDLWVKQEHLLGALHKDLVKVVVLEQGGEEKRAVGRVVEIIERSKVPIVGRLERHGRAAFVVPDGRRMHYDIFIEPEALKRAKDGDKVIVEITDWPNGRKNPQGVVKEVLGQAGLHHVEMHAIMAEFGLSASFPEDILTQANAIPVTLPQQEIARRKDFRGIPTFTIDPEDAKDFDDALSFRALPNGHYEVGIHIADVSYYVQEESLLDQEAFQRGSSVYLVDRTIPMLPEKLSNELCSLRPHEDKLTFSAVFELDDQGKVHQEWFGETIIHSDKRFAYEEAQKAINQQQEDFYEALTKLNELSKQLRIDRFKQGAINFETIEVKFRLDAQGKPLQVVPKVRMDTHKLVEEFMLLANKHVATYVQKMVPQKEKPTFVYRIHGDPNPEKLSDFFLFVKQLGYEVSTKNKAVSYTINALSEAVVGKAEENIVQTLAIRTMAKALYSTEAKAHFGLAFKHYTHFTSPIRRYPDIMVHRLLKKYLQGQFEINQRLYEERCKYASNREQIAMDAERASIKYKQVEFMEQLKGEVLEGVICSIAEWGLYIELTASQCEGMVRLADMKDDYYEVDEKGFRVIGRRSKKTYRLGDQVQVQIKACDVTKRTIDLILID